MGKIAVFFRFIFSIILGFLPSFMFIWIFMRGSVLYNYKSFLYNFELSKWAWISAIGLAFLIFMIWNILKSKSSSKKYLITLIILLLLIGGVFAFAQSYMYLKFFLGGDTLVHLSADKQNIYFGNNLEETISFETSVSLTPFCSAECNYEFFDLTNGREIEKGSFEINPILSKTKTISLIREDIKIGQTLKKFTVTCKSKKTRLCYTLEKKNQKAILITVNYGRIEENSNSMCCYSGICKKCCNNNCLNNNYPIIFLHGHSLSSLTPADYSLDNLLAIKEKLASENYIDAGTLVISEVTEEKGLWGRADFPFMMTASYFFDVYKDSKGNILTTPSNEDSIDTYALRLKDIIDLVKYKTNKDKVIIVAHSMGGVITRRYVQIFGASNIDKAIFLSVPNHGVDSKVTGLCGVLGSDVVCKDLNQNSLFLNKLNNAPTEKIEIHNIIGTGCYMDDETGDGIVKNSSQYLDYAENYYVSGKCDELKLTYLHNEIGNPYTYPEVYDIVNKVIKE